MDSDSARRRVLIAVSIPIVALGVQWLLWSYIGPFVWFLFFPTVFLSARIGGFSGGLAATILSTVLVWYFFMPPQLAWGMKQPGALWSACLFLVMGYLFSESQERLLRANQRTKELLEETREANERTTRLYERTLELDELKSRFFANVSHELRTPLTLILAPLGRRLANASLSVDERRETEMMERNARLLYRHVGDLLDTAKIEAGGMSVAYSRLDLAELVRETAAHFESLAREKGIDFVIETPAALETEVDREKVQRILLNLLSNAHKFTPDGGSVGVRLREEAEAAVITVRDDGPGVPEEMRSAIFERFRQGEGSLERRFSGTGLGLAIARDFAELHGGTASVSEPPGGGALFEIRLPLRAPAGASVNATVTRVDDVIGRQVVEELRAASATGAYEEVADASPSAPLVLVVDDNADMRGFIEAALRPLYRVATASDGREALEKALTLSPDLIVSDIMMPLMSGDLLVAELRRRPATADIPIVVISARADDALRVRLFQEGIQEYLSKPFSVAELLARVGGLVVSRRRTLEELALSATRLRRLAETVERVAGVRDLPELLAIVRPAVKELTGADGAALILRDGDECHYVDEEAISPLRKGQRLPLDSCISGWVIRNRRPAAVEDVYADDRIPESMFRPTLVRSLSVVPVGRDEPVGAIGCYWARQHRATPAEVELQLALADAMSVGLANLELFRRTNAARQAAELSAIEARASAAALKVAQNLAGIGSWKWDTRADVHTWSEEVYRIYGRDPALPPAVYPEVQKYFTPESWANLAAAVQEGVANGVPYECDAEVVRPDGDHRWITARGEATRDATGAVVELHGTVQDITARKLAEETLQESETRFRLLSENSSDSVFWIGPDGRYVYVSPACEGIFGFTPQDLAADPNLVMRMVHPDDREAYRGHVVDPLVADDADLEFRIVRADGALVWISHRCGPMLDGSGRLLGRRGTFRNVTDRKKAEEALNELNASLEKRVHQRTAELTAANEDLDAFAYAVSHDLRAPLRAMSGFSSILKEDYGDRLDGEANAWLDQIQVASRKMGELIDGMLLLSRSARGEMRHDTVDVSMLATRLLAELDRTEPGRNVIVEVEPGLVVAGDPRIIEVVMVNLLGNAWKYTGRTPAAVIRVMAGEVAGLHGVCVTDNGAGFDMEHAARLFQPFQRLHRQDEFPGIGIGLATVQRVVRRHGGEIRAEAAPGKGASFCFSLPAERPE